MVMVLGHTACGAIKGATATYLQAKSGNKPKAVGRVILHVLTTPCGEGDEYENPSRFHTDAINVFSSEGCRLYDAVCLADMLF